MRALLIVAAVAATLAPRNAEAACELDTVINCGHRGTGTKSNSDFPENTVPAFVQAEAEGAQMIEIDVLHSADGVLVAIHDDEVDRTTDGVGCVGNLTVAELQMLDAGVGTSMEGAGVRIPTLAEALAAISVDVNIELKIRDIVSCPPSDLAKMAADVVSAIQTDNKDRRIVVSSFDPDVLTEIKNRDATIYAGFLTAQPSDAMVAVQRGFEAINLLSIVARDEVTVQNILGMGLDLNVWTENDPFNMEDRMLAGVNMIITDDPDVLETVRTQVCERLAEEAEDSGGCRQGPSGASMWLLLGAVCVLVRRRRLVS